MKKIILFAFVFAFFSSYAQNEAESFTKRKEIHLRLNNFSPISVGVEYKHELKENKFLNVSLVNLGFRNQRSVPNLSNA